MQSRYNVINLKDFYLPNREFSISESDLTDFLASFSSPLNQDIEQFLHRTAVESSKKGQSSTYIVIDNEYEHLAGYFTLSLRAISVPFTKVSKSMGRKLSRISDFDNSTDSYTLAAYLIAQLGKNFSITKEQQIKGVDLLNMAHEQIMMSKYALGGIVEFLECEDNAHLLDFYAKNSFIPFNTRKSKSMPPHSLHQLLRLI